jgi:hypothetical protein
LRVSEVEERAECARIPHPDGIVKRLRAEAAFMPS